jgi:micrococcal nuclease
MAAGRKKSVQPEPVRWLQGTVVQVFDGDTLVLADGTRVRLLDINTPEISHGGRVAEPGSYEAAQRLRHLALGQAVAVSVRGKGFDRYGRTLGHVYLQPSHIWLNGVLVREGLAHVYTFADNVRFGRELLPLEELARTEKRGLWKDARWRVRDAATCCPPQDIDKFALVEGTVHNVAAAGKAIYLNFGPDYRTDFSVWVKRKDLRLFKALGWKELACLDRATVRVRGRLDPVDGVLMRVTHPEQITLLRGGACPQKTP